MTAVHALIHLHDFDDGSADFKLIGVFSSPERAAQAQAVTAELAGFRDFPDGFLVVPLEADRGPAGEGLPAEPHLLLRILEEPGHGEEVVILGAYRSEEQAQAAASAHHEGPPEAELEASPVDLDERTWADGFFIVRYDEE